MSLRALGVSAITAALVSLLIHGGIAGWAVISVAVYALLYALSLPRRPFSSCRKCGGSGRHKGLLFTYAHRQCPTCGGSGRHRREGLVIFRNSQPTRAEVQARAAASRRNRPL